MNMNAHPNQPKTSRGRRLARRVVITLAAWLAAYAVVNIVVTLGGAPFAAAPAAVRMLILSGVLVIIMLNVLMPVLGGLIARLFAARP